MKLALSPREAWNPLPSSAWNEEAARHLLRRVGWSAQPEDVARALTDGLPATLVRLLPAAPASMPMPPSLGHLKQNDPDFYRRLRAASPADRRQIRRQAREQSRSALFDLTIRWLQRARSPEYAALEKWTLFLGNVYVVAAQKVQDTLLLYRHQDLLRTRGLGKAPALTKGVLRSPAMIVYLDLQQNRVGAPNENFARECMELFTLGVGHYTERDIKEVARAFTGYVQRVGRFHFVRRRHDYGDKTIFGRTGRFDGDGVIDLIYEQPAAATHLPERMTRFYLTDEPLPAGHLKALGAWWRSTGFDLHQLTHRYFGSRLFFEPQFRSNYIKSPIQYYLGLLQDFSLDVPPLPRRLEPAFRQMGQMPFNPPNVRGWVGGREWISSTSLDARRLVARSVFFPINEARLNADEQRAIAAARASGRGAFAVDRRWFEPYAGRDPEETAAALLRKLLPGPAAGAYRQSVAGMLRGGRWRGTAAFSVRNATVALLETPDYQLC